jgi:hypothetical protein
VPSFVSESELLYNWRFTANQFVLAPSSLRFMTRDFFLQMNPCSHSSYVTTFLLRGKVCLLWIGLAFVKFMYRTYSMFYIVYKSFGIPGSLLTESEPYVTTNGQSDSLYWNKAPIWSLLPDFYYCQTVVGLLLWGVLSDKRTGLSFTVAAGPRQCSHSRVWVPWDSRLYFIVSDLRLPFCHLLWLAGLQWKYLAPPPCGILFWHLNGSCYRVSAQTI